MSDNNLTPEEEARRRAERVNAIKNSVRSAESNEGAEKKPKPLKPISNNNHAETSAPQKKNTNNKNASGKKKSGKKKKKKKTLGRSLRELFPEKGDSVLEKIRKVVFLCSIIAIVVCGYLVGDYYLDLWKSSQLNKDLVQIHNTYDYNATDDTSDTGVESEKYYTLLESAKKLLDSNRDLIGWISIPDTPIDYPIVQADDNKKYLNLSFNGKENRAGTIFLDYRCHFDEVIDHRLAVPNSENLVIYGHNMADGSMFGTLNYYQTYDYYYSQHPIIELNSNYERYKYKIFAFFIVDASDDTATKYDCWNKLYFSGEEDFYNFVNEAKKRSLRLNDVDVQYGDPIITLSTCNTILGERGRFIVMARRVRDGEDLYSGTQNDRANTNIKYPTLYYQNRPYESYDPNAPFVPYGSKTEDTTDETGTELTKGESNE